MTEKMWYSRSRARIFAVVGRSGRISVRNLKRATHYNRGPAEGGISIWYEALEDLKKKGRIRFQCDEYDNVIGDVFLVGVTTELKPIVTVRYKESSPQT
jgi:hypothetical protein